MRINISEKLVLHELKDLFHEPLRVLITCDLSSLDSSFHGPVVQSSPCCDSRYLMILTFTSSIAVVTVSRPEVHKTIRNPRELNRRVDREYSFLDGVLSTSNSNSTSSSESSSSDFLHQQFLNLQQFQFQSRIVGRRHRHDLASRQRVARVHRQREHPAK